MHELFFANRLGTAVRTALKSQAWLRGDLESAVAGQAVATLVPQHLAEVRGRREELVLRTMAASKIA